MLHAHTHTQKRSENILYISSFIMMVFRIIFLSSFIVLFYSRKYHVKIKIVFINSVVFAPYVNDIGRHAQLLYKCLSLEVSTRDTILSMKK